MIESERLNKALALLKKGPANVDYFFDKLESSEWVEPLATTKLFSTPYPARESAGFIQFPFWPPGVYLARMATHPDVQRQVADIFRKLPRSDNPRVYESVADAAIALPEDLARLLLDQLLRGAELRYQLLLPEKLTALICRFASAGYRREAMALVKGLFTLIRPEPVPTTGRVDPGHRGATARFNLWQYGELLERCLKPMVEAGGEEFVRFLIQQLRCAVDSESLDVPLNGRDYSVIWRPEIAHRADGRHNDIRDDLVSAVVEAIELMRSATLDKWLTALSHLRAESYDVFRRIGLHEITHAEAIPSELIDEWCGDATAWGDPFLQPEFEQAIARHFGSLSTERQSAYLALVLKGPPKARRGNPEADGDIEDEGAAEVSSDERWIRNHLATVESWLPAEAKQVLERLIAKHGPSVPQGPQFRMTVGWRGEVSPVSRDDALEMPLTQLLELARTWDDPKQFDGPSEAGLAESLRDRVEAKPGEALAFGDECVTLKTQYLAGVLDGFERVVRAKGEIDWVRLLRLLEKSIVRGQSEPSGDGHARWIRQTAASILEHGLERESAGIAPTERTAVQAVLRLLLQDVDPDAEADAVGVGAMDPATKSLNCVRGRTMHALMKSLLWWRRSIEAEANPEPRLSAGIEEFQVERELLERHLDLSIDSALAVRSVYGQWFPWLLLVDRKWATALREQIFPSEAGQQLLFESAWSAYVCFNRPYTAALLALEPAYRRVVTRLPRDLELKNGFGEAPVEHLTRHLMVYYWRGELGLDADSLVELFFARASGEQRGRAFEWIGWNLQRDDTPVDKEAGSRLQLLWNWRAASGQMSHEERVAFGGWFASGKLEPEWSFLNLEALLRDRVVPAHSHSVAEELARLATSAPLRCVHAIEALIGLVTERWEVHSWQDEIRAVLQIALSTSDEPTKREARRVLNKLGAMGMGSLRDLHQLTR